MEHLFDKGRPHGRVGVETPRIKLEVFPTGTNGTADTQAQAHTPPRWCCRIRRLPSATVVCTGGYHPAPEKKHARQVQQFRRKRSTMEEAGHNVFFIIVLWRLPTSPCFYFPLLVL